MLVSLDWIKEFVPFEVSSERLAHTLTMLGLEVEEIFWPFRYLKDVVIGRIISCSSHPNADKLKLCKVDVGGEVLDIICGAPNVDTNQLVAVAKIGAKLPEGLEVRKVKIRGVNSYGTICSERELGLGDDHSGILVLNGDYSPGSSLIDVFNLDFEVFDIGITPNRGDCLSVLGIAREISAFYNIPLNVPSVLLKEDLDVCESEIEVDITATQKCFLYQARIVKGVEVKPSPNWMRFRLLACGIRPINNIVDITNYVLLESGHPLHAFDLDLIDGKKIRVDTANQGDKFITLDGKERVLTDEDLLILDGVKPIALAGIMGGANSEIKPDTKDVLIECAVFDPKTIRRTARRLGISSESSYRFERGVDQANASFPIDRAASLMKELAGGCVLKGVVKSEPRPWVDIKVDFRLQRVKQLLDLDIKEEEGVEILRRLGCKVEKVDVSLYNVFPPSFRHDLVREVDLIEEIARFHGYHNIPEKLPNVIKSSFQLEQRRSDFSFLGKIKDWAKGLGFREVINYSFVSFEDLKILGFKEDELVKIYNPLTSEQDTMRPLIVPGLLKNIKYNLSQSNKNLRLFEIASVFYPNAASETLTEEITKIGFVTQGRRVPDFWPWDRQNVDYLDIKGVVEHLFLNLSIDLLDFILIEKHSFLDPCVGVVVEDKEVGFIGKVKDKICDFYDIKSEDVWIAELDLDQIYNIYKDIKISFSMWSKYPPVFRDMTVILIENLEFKYIKRVIEEAGISYLEDVKLIDIYRATSDSKPHLTLRMVYRHPNRTLTDKEVDELHMKLGQLILEKLPVRFP